MDTTELLKKVRRIEIKTRGLSRNIFAGNTIRPLKEEVWHFRRCASTSSAMM